MSAARSSFRRHRRTIFKVIALLAAGATLNVAVAWGCVVHAYDDTGRPRSMSIFPKVEDFDWWTLQAPAGMARPQQLKNEVNIGYVSRELGARGGMIPNLLLNAPSATRPLYEQSVRVRAGWPMYALYGEWFTILMPNRPEGFGEVHRGFLIPNKSGLTSGLFRVTSNDTPRIPVMPHWPGFAVNTLFYAGVLWMLFAIPFALRRMIRRRRGQCAMCAYPIGSSAVCTECGAAV